MTITSTPLKSTCIATATYDDDTETLTLDFVNGSSYDFDGVPQSIYQQLISAPSPGRYFNTMIKNAY